MIPTGSREQAWRYEVWDRNGYTGRNLTGVKGGSLEWNKNQAIKGRGSLNVVENTDGPLLDVFIRPVLTLEGFGEQAYGLWVPSFPTKAFKSSTWSGVVALLSFEALLTFTSAASILNVANQVTVLVPQATVVTTWLSAALELAGFNRYAIQASAKTETAPQAYVRGETALQVFNAELDRIGYTSLYSDMEGTLRADLYVLPGDRSESFSDLRPFDVNGNPIFLSTFNFTDNAPNVPNRVRAVGKSIGWLPGQTGFATNNDPDSPYSVVNRGYVIEKVYTEVNGISQVEVQSYANQQLLNLSKDGRKAEIKFLHLPGLALNNVMYFNAPRAGDPMFATVDSLGVDLNPTGNSSATLTAVTAVDEDEFV